RSLADRADDERRYLRGRCAARRNGMRRLRTSCCAAGGCWTATEAAEQWLVGVIFHRGVYLSFRGEPVVSSTVYGRFVPQATLSRRSKPSLFDYLVGAG